MFKCNSCQNEGTSSTCSTSKIYISTTAASSAAKATCAPTATAAPSIDKYVCKAQPQGAMRGEKLVKANELLVKALTANLLPPALMDSAEIRELLEFISNGTYIPPHRTKVTELIDAQYDMVFSKVSFVQVLYTYIGQSLLILFSFCI